MKFNNNRHFISLYIKVASFLIHLFICDIRTIRVDDHVFLHAVLESDSSVPV